MRLIFGLLMLPLALGLAACGATKQSTQIERRGFLGDYSKLRPGKEGELAFIYRNPSADWAAYDKILLDPVSVWTTRDTSNIPQEDLQRLANNFYGLLYQEWAKDYEMVEQPGPKTLRIQVALTGADTSNAVLDLVSTVHPVSFAVSSGAEFVVGEPTFGGGASIEGKVMDANTGALLAAGIDRRVAGKDISGAFDSWDDVNSAFQYWAQWSRFRLCELRRGAGCIAPE